MAEDLEDRIRDAADGPAEASGDGGSMKQQPLGELIKADQHLKSKAAARKNHRGLRYTKIEPPGAS